jgi:hypothetical protein
LLIADSLADAFLARGLFHFGPHGAQVVAGRHYWEEDDEQTSECQEALEGIEPASLGRSSRVTPQPVGGHRQQQPEKVEQKFHLTRNFGLEMNTNLNVVFQKVRIPVNVTFVFGDSGRKKRIGEHS